MTCMTIMTCLTGRSRCSRSLQSSWPYSLESLGSSSTCCPWWPCLGCRPPWGPTFAWCRVWPLQISSSAWAWCYTTSTGWWTLATGPHWVLLKVSARCLTASSWCSKPWTPWPWTSASSTWWPWLLTTALPSSVLCTMTCWWVDVRVSSWYLCCG